MNKKQYVKPAVELVEFDASDVVVASGGYWSCGTENHGNYRDLNNCDQTIVSDNSMD